MAVTLRCHRPGWAAAGGPAWWNNDLAYVAGFKTLNGSVQLQMIQLALRITDGPNNPPPTGQFGSFQAIGLLLDLRNTEVAQTLLPTVLVLHRPRCGEVAGTPPVHLREVVLTRVYSRSVHQQIGLGGLRQIAGAGVPMGLHLDQIRPAALGLAAKRRAGLLRCLNRARRDPNDQSIKALAGVRFFLVKVNRSSVETPLSLAAAEPAVARPRMVVISTAHITLSMCCCEQHQRSGKKRDSSWREPFALSERECPRGTVGRKAARKELLLGLGKVIFQAFHGFRSASVRPGPKEPNSSEINWSRLSVVPITCSMMGRAQGAFQ